MAKGRRRTPLEREPPDGSAAMDIAARFLATRPRSRWEVGRRLKRAGADDEVTGATLERLSTLGYLDDVAFARWWLEQRDRHAPRGRRMIEAELRTHGVAREVLAQLDDADLARPDGEELPETEAERAAMALRRHLRGRPLPDDAAGLRRIGLFLVRRGFDPETVRAAIRRAASESLEDSESER